MFDCDKCGLCCIGLNKSELTKHMHNGDGICKHLDLDTMLCRIYEERPIFCRVEEYYDKYLKDKMEKETFLRLNAEACELKKQELIDCGGDIYKMVSLIPDMEGENRNIVSESLENAFKEL